MRSSTLNPGDTTDPDAVEETEWDYSIRGPNDYVVVRPVGFFANGRITPSAWATARFGDRLKSITLEHDVGFYIFLVRKP